LVILITKSLTKKIKINKMAIVKTHAKGQVIIPKAIRDKLGIKPGTSLHVELIEDHLEIRPLPDDPIEFLTGIFEGYSGSMSADLLDERVTDDAIDETNSL